MNLISCEKLEKSMVELQFSIDAAAFKDAVSKAFKRESKKYQVPGFRKGKAPRAMIEKMYGADIFQYDAVNDLFPTAYEEAVQAAGIEVVGRPEPEVVSMSEADGAVLKVKVAVKPEVEIGEYAGLEVTKKVKTVDESMVDAEIKRMQDRNGRLLTREGAAENGDTVDIDFEGFVGDVAFEGGGVNLELLTFIDGEFRAKQTLAVGAGSYNGCAALHAGAGPDGKPWLILDGKVGTGGNTLASSIIQYDDETGFLQLYNPPGVWDLFSATLRYDTTLLSCDVDGSGSVDIPSELDDGGTLVAPLDKRLRFVLWKDYATPSGGRSRFGVYDGEYRFFVPLPESLHGSVTLRENAAGTGWRVCSADGTSLYAELRVVPPAEDGEPDGGYTRVGNIGDQQLQVRILTPYYGLTVDRLREEIVMMG